MDHTCRHSSLPQISCVAGLGTNSKLPIGGLARLGSSNGKKIRPPPRDPQPKISCTKSGRTVSKAAVVAATIALPHIAAHIRDESRRTSMGERGFVPFVDTVADDNSFDGAPGSLPDSASRSSRRGPVAGVKYGHSTSGTECCDDGVSDS